MSRKSRRRTKKAQTQHIDFASNTKANRPSTYLPRKGSELFATAKNDVTVPFYSDVLEPQDPTLKSKARHLGLKLYDEILQDGRARAAFNKRIGKLTKREWDLLPASEEQIDIDVADHINDILNELPFDQICKSLLKAILKGYAVSEIVWHRNKSGWIAPHFIKSHDPARFKFDRDWKPRLLTRESGIKGIELPERKFIVHRFEAEGNNPYGLGLGSVLYWHVLFKRQGASFWLVHLEKFASPTPFGRYPAGTSNDEQDRLLGLLRRLVQNGALVAPIGTEVDFIEAQRAGNAGHEEWCRYWDEQTAEVVLGSTLSTSVKGQGARAASETHAEETESLVDDDADQLCATLNDTLIKWICEANWPNATPPTLVRPRPLNQDKEEEQKRKRQESHQAAIKTLGDLRGQGFEPKNVSDWLGDLLGVEMIPAQSKQITADTPAFASDDDPIAHIVDQLSDLNAPEVEQWLSTLKSRLQNTNSFAEASKALLAAQADLKIDALGNNLADAISLSDLTGRGDIYDLTGISGSKKN